MSFWDPFNLIQLPLSAYTPGQGDKSMEGGLETASGEPVYTFEMWRDGKAPYVTGATSQKNPSGALVYRQLGDQTVPVRITDYGPGVKGIDIASSNKSWANNFPYQGARDRFLLADDRSDLNDLLNQDPATQFLGKPQPTPTPTPAPVRVASADGMGAGQFPIGASGASLADYASLVQPASTGGNIAGIIGSALGKLGAGMQQDSQARTAQALSMMNNRSGRSMAELQQFAANPLQFLVNPYLQGVM